MRTHPLVPIIRRCLAWAMLVAVACYAPEWALFLLAGGLGWWPGCGCCSSCTIFSDDFSTDRTGSEYTTGSGTWTVAAGALTCTSASALITENTASDGGATANYVAVTVTPASTSDSGGPVGAYTDANTYWFALVQPGAANGTLKLFQRSGGVNTQRGSTVTLTGYTSGAKTVCLCFANGNVSASVGTSVVNYTASVTVSSKTAGMTTGAGSSSVAFDNFSYKKHRKDDSNCNTCCDGGTCTTHCIGDVESSEVQLVVAGVGNSGVPLDPCNGDCSPINGTFVLHQTSSCAYESDSFNYCFGTPNKWTWEWHTTNCDGGSSPCYSAYVGVGLSHVDFRAGSSFPTDCQVSYTGLTTSTVSLDGCTFLTATVDMSAL